MLCVLNYLFKIPNFKFCFNVLPSFRSFFFYSLNLNLPETTIFASKWFRDEDLQYLQNKMPRQRTQIWWYGRQRNWGGGGGGSAAIERLRGDIEPLIAGGTVAFLAVHNWNIRCNIVVIQFLFLLYPCFDFYSAASL